NSDPRAVRLGLQSASLARGTCGDPPPSTWIVGTLRSANCRLRDWVPRVLGILHIRTSLDLRGAAVSSKPKKRSAYCGKGSEVARIELRDIDLRFARATEVFLANADLRGTKTSLRGANLSNAILCDATVAADSASNPTDLVGADFAGADLRNADLSKTDLQGADFRHADLRGATLSGATVQDADFTDAKLWMTCLAVAPVDPQYAVVWNPKQR